MSEENNNSISNAEIARLTVQLASAYTSKNNVNSPDDLFILMGGIKNKIEDIAKINVIDVPAQPKQITQEKNNNEEPAVNSKILREPINPAVKPEESVFEDHIICLEDGKKVKMLKRYLKTNYDLTPDAYRRRWNLPDNYPMVSPAISKARSETARKSDLGHAKERADAKKQEQETENKEA
ncbi:MucR family transcriptional regulator [Gluconobacter cerinus]|uniref:MucR family transcriptional regulator n=1 Tax=Gluconobacter cerinus TaxID=38307 RepID=UPI001B8D2985|nr:MucR family transcriptional regulator [Gluconobacter cerinus]MBS0984517.1 MucR family transcriptional regulator [Gluconobacter cerinus]